METSHEIVGEMYDATNFFCELMEDYFYGDDSSFSMEMFSELCEHIKNTYRAFHESENREVLLHALKPFEQLVKIANFPEVLDTDHEIIELFADKTVAAIEYIVAVWSKANVIEYRDVIIYDLDNDTPETVYNRLKSQIE